MLGRQLDLFSGRGLPGGDDLAARVEPARLVPRDLDDAALVGCQSKAAAVSTVIARLRVGRCADLSRSRVVGRMHATREDVDGPGAR